MAPELGRDSESTDVRCRTVGDLKAFLANVPDDVELLDSWDEKPFIGIIGLDLVLHLRDRPPLRAKIDAVPPKASRSPMLGASKVPVKAATHELVPPETTPARDDVPLEPEPEDIAVRALRHRREDARAARARPVAGGLTGGQDFLAEAVGGLIATPADEPATDEPATDEPRLGVSATFQARYLGKCGNCGRSTYKGMVIGRLVNIENPMAPVQGYACDDCVKELPRTREDR